MKRQELIKKIESLPPDRFAEVESFVESLEYRDSNASALHKALADFAAQHAGTDADLNLLDQQRTAIRESVEEVLEEIALSRAIEEGQQTNQATRDEVFHILEKREPPIPLSSR